MKIEFKIDNSYESNFRIVKMWLKRKTDVDIRVTESPVFNSYLSFHEMYVILYNRIL